MKNLLICFAGLFIFLSATGQKDPEFPKGFVMYLGAHDGVVTNFTNAPDLFTAGLRFGTLDAPIVSDYEIEKLNTPDELRRAVMASACQPVFMQPIEVKKGAVPMRQYVDGGVREYAGIQLAIDAGADEIFAILLTPGKKEVNEQPYNDAFSILQDTIDIFTAAVGYNDVRVPGLYNRALQYIASVKQKMLQGGIPQNDIDNYFNIPFSDPFAGKTPRKIYVIRPDEPLGGGPGGLNFDPTEMKGMLVKGQQRINDYIAALPPGEFNTA